MYWFKLTGFTRRDEGHRMVGGQAYSTTDKLDHIFYKVAMLCSLNDSKRVGQDLMGLAIYSIGCKFPVPGFLCVFPSFWAGVHHFCFSCSLLMAAAISAAVSAGIFSPVCLFSFHLSSKETVKIFTHTQKKINIVPLSLLVRNR